MGGKQSFPRVQVPKDRTFIVTGANRGIGYEVAKWIAMLGGTVIMACRSEDDTVKAMRQMDKEYNDEKSRGTPGLVDVAELPLVFMRLDLSSLQSTMEFVQEFKTSGRPLHVLICNAGVSKAKPGMTDDGFEYMLQVNFLAHFLLVGQLLPKLKQMESKEDIRIIIVSSDAHKMCKFDVDIMNSEWSPNKLGPIEAYGRTKLYQIMQMYCLQRRLHNTNITVTSAHPGMVDTRIGAEFSDNAIWRIMVSMANLIGAIKTPLEGAETIIDLAVNPTYKNVTGEYFKNCHVATPTAQARDEDKQEALWQKSIEYLKGKFTEEELLCLEGADLS